MQAPSQAVETAAEQGDITPVAAQRLLEAAQDAREALHLLRIGVVPKMPETREMFDVHIDLLETAIAHAESSK